MTIFNTNNINTNHTSISTLYSNVNTYSKEQCILNEDNLKIHTILNNFNDLFQKQKQILEHIPNEYVIELIRMDLKLPNNYVNMNITKINSENTISKQNIIQLYVCLLFSNFKHKTLILCETNEDCDMWYSQIYSILKHRPQILNIGNTIQTITPICITTFDTLQENSLFEEIDEYYWNRIITYYSSNERKQSKKNNKTYSNTYSYSNSYSNSNMYELDYNVLLEV